MTRWFSPPIPRKTAETASVTFKEIPQRELRVEGPVTFVMVLSRVKPVTFKEIPQRELRVRGRQPSSPKSWVWVTFKEIPQRELRVFQRVKPLPLYHHHFRYIQRNPTKGIESSYQPIAYNPFDQSGYIQRNPTKGIESWPWQCRQTPYRPLVTFKEIPQRELRVFSPITPSPPQTKTGYIQRNPTKGIESPNV